MTKLHSIFLILALLPLATFCIHAGQKISIQRVPFYALCEGKLKDKTYMFSGIILDEKLVLTVADPILQ